MEKIIDTLTILSFVGNIISVLILYFTRKNHKDWNTEMKFDLFAIQRVLKKAMWKIDSTEARVLDALIEMINARLAALEAKRPFLSLLDQYLSSIFVRYKRQQEKMEILSEKEESEH